MSIELQGRVRALIDDDLMSAYAESVKALGSPDLVLLLDVGKRDLQAQLRSKFQIHFRASLGKEAEGSEVLKKVARPASAAMTTLKGPLAFWLVAMFPDEELVCVAVGGQRLGDGSVALS